MIGKGHIDLSVGIDQFEQIQFIDYSQCYQQTEASENFYTAANSSIWQMFDESPSWVHDLAAQVPQDFSHHVVSVIKLMPGNTIPLHRDYHYILQQKFGQGNTWRYLIFLEDWKSGHYFEISKQPCTSWQAGDWIKFSRDQWHLAGNMGQQPFYSAQITVM